MNKQDAFNNYVSKFCDLDLSDKRENIVNNLLELLAVMQKVAKDMDNNTELLLNKEVLDAKNLKECSEEDFDETIFVYINSIQESFGVILNQITKDYYE